MMFWMLWPLHEEGHCPFEQHPLEPRSAVVEQVPDCAAAWATNNASTTGAVGDLKSIG